MCEMVIGAKMCSAVSAPKFVYGKLKDSAVLVNNNIVVIQINIHKEMQLMMSVNIFL